MTEKLFFFCCFAARRLLSLCVCRNMLAGQKREYCYYYYTTPCLKTSHLWLAIILTYMARLRKFLAQVGNQSALYFLTSPNLCLCTIWVNRKPENCVFSLKCCMLFTKNTWNTLTYHLVTAEPPFTVKTIDGMHQIGPRILLFYPRDLC